MVDLNDEKGTIPPKQYFATAQYFVFGTFHVDLDEFRRAAVLRNKFIKSRGGDCNGRPVRQDRLAAVGHNPAVRWTADTTTEQDAPAFATRPHSGVNDLYTLLEIV